MRVEYEEELNSFRLYDEKYTIFFNGFRYEGGFLELLLGGYIVLLVRDDDAEQVHNLIKESMK